MGLIEKLEFVVNNKFERITYTEAIDVLLVINAYTRKKFQYEKLVLICRASTTLLVGLPKPVIVTNYPKDIKAFYMRQDGMVKP